MAELRSGRGDRIAHRMVLGLGIAHILLAGWFAHERILNTDCSYQLFTSVNEERFFFQEHRYGMFLTQLPMMIALALKAPMDGLIHLYSVTFPILYLVLALLMMRVWRDAGSALAALLCLTAGASATFFHCTTETHLLIVLSALLYSALVAAKGHPRPYRHMALILALALWNMFTHPNALFTVVFVVVLALIHRHITWAQAMPAMVVVVLYSMVKWATVPADAYDARQTQALMKGLGRWHELGRLHPVWYLREYYWTHYAAISAALVFLLVGQKDRLVGAWTLVSVATFLLVTIFTFHLGDSDAMMEKSFMPAVLMVMLPFAELVDHERLRKGVLALCGVLAALGLFTIIRASIPYSERLLALDRLLVSYPGSQKIAAAFTDLQDEQLEHAHWATSFDVLMRSQTKGALRTVFLTEDPSLLENGSLKEHVFLSLPWDPFGIELRNDHYFNLSQDPYLVVRKPVPPRDHRVR